MTNTIWNEHSARRYMGEFKNSYFGYSLIETIRENAASGGITSTLILAAFRENLIDGALLCRSIIQDNKVAAEYFVARTESEIKQSQGSKYISAKFSKDALSLIHNFEGRLAVVCLPCEARMLHYLRKKDSEVDNKIKFVITLFCGHASEKELTELVLHKLNPEHKPLKDFRYRFGHWRGNLKIDFQDGTQVIKPFSFFSDYQNLFFFAEKKCLQCVDHTGVYSDISIGDIWSLKMKNNPIKHNAILVRTAEGTNLVKQMQNNNLASIFHVPAAEVCKGQSRSLLLHASVNARSSVSSSYNIKINTISDEKSSLLEKSIAKIILHNYFHSHKEKGLYKINLIPRFFIKVYLYLFKALQILQKPNNYFIQK